MKLKLLISTLACTAVFITCNVATGQSVKQQGARLSSAALSGAPENT